MIVVDRRCDMKNTKVKLLLFLLLKATGESFAFFFDDLLEASDNGQLGQNLPNTGPQIENILFRSCFVCHGTSVSSVTSSCWETVNEDHKRFVSVKSCVGACSMTVLNHTSIGLIDYTRRCEPECRPGCSLTDQNTHLCKYCCYGDKCNGVLPTYTPKGPETIAEVSQKNLRTFMDGAMAKPRHHSVNPSNKIAARKKIVNLWRHFGLAPEMQQFKIAQTVLEDKSPSNYRSYIKTVIKGYNIITTVRGRHYGTINDEVIVLMAHYDTHPGGTAGVDDNASGVAVLLEVSRLLMRDETCDRHYSVILVATDFNEQGNYWDGLAGSDYTNCVMGDQYVGLTGASHFLCGYLLPHLRLSGSRVIIALNLNSILNFDSSPASQSLPDLRDFITGRARYSNAHYRRFENQVSRRRYVGDWVLASYAQVEYNSKTTRYYADKLERTWNSLNDDQMGLIKQHIPVDGQESQAMQVDDCFPYVRLRHPLPCISLTDTGINIVDVYFMNNTLKLISTFLVLDNSFRLTYGSTLRGYMRGCHHQACDDDSHITDENLQFMSRITDSVWRLIEELSESGCLPSTTVAPTTSAVITASSIENQEGVNDREASRGGCSSPLLKISSRRKNSRVSITATCGYSKSSLELCDAPSNGVWGLLNGGTAWIPKKGKKKKNRRLWFQINLGRRSNITGISIQGVPGNGYIRSFMLSYSNNGIGWNWYIPITPLPRTATEIQGTTNKKVAATRTLKPRILAQYIRIHPRKWKRRIALRVELLGCAVR